MARQPKKAREVCKTCGKPGTKWAPLPHNHTLKMVPPTVYNDPPKDLLYEIFGKK